MNAGTVTCQTCGEMSRLVKPVNPFDGKPEPGQYGLSVPCKCFPMSLKIQIDPVEPAKKVSLSTGSSR